MEVYSYNEQFEYCGCAEAKPDPLQPGQYLIPARATTTPPPEFGDNEKPIFTDGGWVVVPDYRGTVYWLPTGEEKTIELLGESLSEDALSEPPPPTAEELQQMANAEARAYLAGTDWYIIRLQETGDPVPQEILDERAAQRLRVVE